MLHDIKPVRSDSEIELIVPVAAIIREGGNALVITDAAEVLEGPVYGDGSVCPNEGEFAPADRTDPEVRRAINALYKRLMPDPGDELVNGARVLDATHTEGFIGIVACSFNDKYVTWALNLQTGGAAHGNYFQEPTAEFWGDYERRVAEEPSFSYSDSFDSRTQPA